MYLKDRLRSKLTNTQAGDYNHKNGRFISEDQLGFKSKEVNLQKYVKNNPLAFSDPSGEITVGTILAFVSVAVFYGAVEQYKAEIELINSLQDQIEAAQRRNNSILVQIARLERDECPDQRKIRRLQRQLSVNSSFIANAKSQRRLAKIRSTAIVFDFISTAPRLLNGVESYVFALFQKFGGREK